MCTAISVTAGDNYFGRNLDYELSFGEKVTITPRNYRFIFKNGKVIENHYSIIGMGLVQNEYPLYFDATNEAGLSMAGLRFADNAVYRKRIEGKENIASFEFIPLVLSQCKNASDAERLISNINITDEAFDEKLKPSPLHWLIADRERSITVEQTERGPKIFENPVGVLTNNPTFDIQMFNLSNFMSVSAYEPENTFSQKLDLRQYSRGMGALGLPGDLSSMSRFVKTSFLLENSVFKNTEEEIVNHFFHILYSVYQLRGTVRVGDSFQITHYTSCCNTDKCVYYYTTYNNSTINAVDLHNENLDGKNIITYSLINKQNISVQNKL